MFGLGTAEFLVLPLLILILVLVVLYLLTLQRALARCSAEVRALSPQLVWLMFIPLANVVWNFVLVVALSRSLGREFRRR